MSRGRIVLAGSVAGAVYTPGNFYGATKWAITGLAENTRRMVTADGVGVTLIAPGGLHTDFWRPAGGVPGPSMLTAHQIAEAIAWAIGRPAGVDVNTVTLRPVGQRGVTAARPSTSDHANAAGECAALPRHGSCGGLDQQRDVSVA